MIREERRRTLTLVLALVGWWGALALCFLQVTEIIEQDLSVVVILCVGVAISAGLSLSRMRLAETMKNVFSAGYSSAGEREDIREARQAGQQEERNHIHDLRMHELADEFRDMKEDEK